MNTKILFLTVTLGFTSLACEDYLKEEFVTDVGYAYFETEAGIEDAVKGIYPVLKEFWVREPAMCMAEFGTDEFTRGINDPNVGTFYDDYDNYGSSLDPHTQYIHDLWDNFYKGINIANSVLYYAPGVKFINPALKEQRIGEAGFLRALLYFVLVRQFGDVPLKTEPSFGPEREFYRAPVADVYKQIISDLRTAESKLPVSQANFGRPRKGAAQHLLALVYLTRASAETTIRGSAATDLDSAVYYSELVINSGNYSLEADYKTIFNYYNLNGTDNPNSKEVIFSIQNTNDPLINGIGSRLHLFYIGRYDAQPGMKRDLFNHAPWRRAHPTDYALDAYDRGNDSRLYKSLKMAWICNNPATAPKDGGVPRFGLGDTALYITLHKNVPAGNVGLTSYKWVPWSIQGGRSTFDDELWPSLNKFYDYHIPTVNYYTGFRDFMIYRFAETYLIAAEAHGRKGNYSQAVTYINIVRTRAAYKTGEVKPKEFYTVEGGNIADLTVSTVPQMQITEAAINSPELLVNFILDERLRELLGENHRWFDLVRCGKLIERVQAHSHRGAGIQPHHKLRPIPQRTYLDRLQVPNPEAQQNPGY